jgi:hypothetical protein
MAVWIKPTTTASSYQVRVRHKSGGHYFVYFRA